MVGAPVEGRGPVVQPPHVCCSRAGIFTGMIRRVAIEVGQLCCVADILLREEGARKASNVKQMAKFLRLHCFMQACIGQ